MNEVEAMEGMLGVLDPAIHVNTAIPAGMALNGGGAIHDLELVTIRRNAHAVAAHDRDLREQCAVGLPALRATANMVMGLSLAKTLSAVKNR